MGVYAWTDLETTGDGDNDHIIEAAVVFTSANLEVIDTFHAVSGLNKLVSSYRASSDPVVREMHDHNGLWAEAEASDLTIGDIDLQLTQLTGEIAGDDKVTLAGSGVAVFDRRFIRRSMHRFESRLNYWVVDVGVIRRFVRDIAHREDLLPTQPEKPHRALADIFMHLDEARFYAETLGGIRGVG